MSETATAPSAKSEPLFTIDLEGNGGHLAPTNVIELLEWLQKEQKFCDWISKAGINQPHTSIQRQALKHINTAINAAKQLNSASENEKQQLLVVCRDSIERAFIHNKLPHSSTPLGKRIQEFRQKADDVAASYFVAAIINSTNDELSLQRNSIAAWHGLFQGMHERFQIAQSASKGKKTSIEQSLNELRVKTEKLLGEKSEALNVLHREFQALTEAIDSTSQSQSNDFTTEQAQRSSEFDALKIEHQKEMEALRRTFKEELALRAPATYWSEKRKNHIFFALLFGFVSFIGILIAAIGLGTQIHELLNTAGGGTTPEPWRIAVLALIGVFTIWALRLVVRMFLSHLHLLTDAGEREVMVKTYLSLMEGGQLDKDNRQLILQALFRPASDGIVKDEGIPFSLAEVLTRTGKS